MNIDDLRNFIESKFRLEIDSEDDQIIIYNYHSYNIELNKSEINEILLKLDSELKNDEAELYNDTYYEVLTHQSNLSLVRTFRSKSFEITDNVNNLSYDYGPALIIIYYL